MKYFFLLISCLTFCESLFAQSYFPPKKFNDPWDTLSLDQTGFCQERIDSLYDFLNRKNSKSFIMLVNGRIALEQYFDDYSKDSLWYYASAGKSVMSFLLGVAQQEGYLEIDSPTSTYLGQYWTSCTPEQERAITVRHQMAMSTGLDDQFKATLQYPDPFNCMDSGCLKYRTDPYDRWFYFNGPYRLTQDVLENATGETKNAYSLQTLGSTGWFGLWFNYVLYGRARDMARFGHLVLNNGVWDGDSILKDQEFYQEMINSSQSINPAYGLLWWLNGKDKFVLPGTAIQFNGSLVPNAPADMFAAMGKDDQRIYVIPSMDMVIIRQGEASGISLFAKSTFDDELWSYLNQLKCTNTVNELELDEVKVYPVPAHNEIHIDIQGSHPIQTELLDLSGASVYSGVSKTLDVSGLENGIYFLRIRQADRIILRKISILR